MSKDYKVGKGRPPLHSRFKPGQSGNPKGRPKGIVGTRDLLRKILSRKITVREGSSEREVTVQEAVLITMAAKAVKGDHRAAALLLKAIETYHDRSGNQIGPNGQTVENAKVMLHKRLEAIANRMSQHGSDA